MPRYLAHAVVLFVAALVAAVGNLGYAAGDWPPLALDRAADFPSALARQADGTQDDILLKPIAPVTQLVNRPRQGIIIYRVQEGETVAGIAEKYEISVPTVLWANGLSEDDILTPGRQLIILPVSGVLHTVQPGEKIEDIARRYQSDVQAIVEFNQLTDPQQIVANDLLVVPGGRREEPSRPVPAVRSDARPQGDPEPRPPASAAVPSSNPGRQTLQAFSYNVASGDSVNSIAEKFGISAETLMWANGLQNDPELIKEGQTLTILPVSGALYTVEEGDSLSQIAEKYGVPIEQIMTANGIDSADDLTIDQKLIVPGARLLTAAEVAEQARAAAAAKAQSSGWMKHTVDEGESLSSIAERYGVDAGDIIEANNLASADLVVIGDQLVIPGVAARPAPARQVAAAAPAAPKPAPAPAPKPAAPAPAPSGGGGSRIVAIASKYLGYRYTWGGHSPSTGFDCTGYTWYVYQQAGIKIPMHDLWGQLQAGPRISQANLQPGDLVFFQNTYRAGLSHSGIYIGGGRFINAEDYGKGVRVANLSDSYWAARYFGASRPW